MVSEMINIVIPKIDLAIYNTRYLNNFQGIFFQGTSKKNQAKILVISYPKNKNVRYTGKRKT